MYSPTSIYISNNFHYTVKWKSNSISRTLWPFCRWFVVRLITTMRIFCDTSSRCDVVYTVCYAYIIINMHIFFIFTFPSYFNPLLYAYKILFFGKYVLYIKWVPALCFIHTYKHIFITCLRPIYSETTLNTQAHTRWWENGVSGDMVDEIATTQHHEGRA